MTSIYRCLLLLSLSFLVLWGCQSKEEAPDIIEEREGVVYVKNPAVGLWQEKPSPPIRFELEQTFGAEEEPVEEILAGARSLTTDAEGHVYVLDYAQRLVAFNPDGSLRWTTGQEGEGPGDFK